MLKRGLFQKILADDQEADIVVPVVVGIVPIGVQVALAGILVKVKIAELAVYVQHIILTTVL